MDAVVDHRTAKSSRPCIVSRYWKLVGALLTMGGTILSLVVLNALLPSEEAPRVRIVDHGATEYCLETLSASILPPMGTVLFITLLWLSGRFVGPSEEETRRQKRRWAPGEFQSSAAWWIDRTCRAILFCVLAPLFAMLLFLLLYAVVLAPCFQIRTIVLDGDALRLDSLLWSWTLSVSQIDRVVIEQTDIERHEQPFVDLGLTIEAKAGRRFKTVTHRLEPDDPELRRRTRLFQNIRTSISNHKPRRQS